MNQQINTLREFCNGVHEGEWSACPSRDQALTALAELEAAMREPYATIEHTVGGSIEHMPLKSAWQLPMGVKINLYIAVPPAQQAQAEPFNHATQLQIAYIKGLGDGARQAQAEAAPQTGASEGGA